MFVHVNRLVQTCFFLICLLDAADPLTGWRDGHGLQPTPRTMAKSEFGLRSQNGGPTANRFGLERLDVDGQAQ